MWLKIRLGTFLAENIFLLDKKLEQIYGIMQILEEQIECYLLNFKPLLKKISAEIEEPIFAKSLGIMAGTGGTIAEIREKISALIAEDGEPISAKIRTKISAGIGEVSAKIGKMVAGLGESMVAKIEVGISAEIGKVVAKIEVGISIMEEKLRTDLEREESEGSNTRWDDGAARRAYLAKFTNGDGIESLIYKSFNRQNDYYYFHIYASEEIVNFYALNEKDKKNRELLTAIRAPQE